MENGKPAGIFEALAIAQAGMESPRFDGENPHFHSKYATLGECERVVKKATAPLGIFFHYDTQKDADGEKWVVTVIHYGDQCIRLCPIPVLFAGQSQQKGSELTYARRYSLCGAFAICADEDDDANTADGKPSTRPKNPAKAKPKEKTPAQILDDACKAYARAHGLTIEDARDAAFAHELFVKGDAESYRAVARDLLEACK